MLEKPISPLRQRMIDDMTARRFKEKVQRDYVRHVRTFAAFLGRSPDTATSEDLRRFQLHMAQQQISAGSINAAVAALRFFFNVTLERPDLVRHLTTVNTPRRAPVVLSQEEVARLLEAAPGLKVKAALSVAYGAGLRVSEVVALKVSDIDSERMTLRVERGKGQRDRYVMLSPQLLELLREWWRAARPQAWLFPGQFRACGSAAASAWVRPWARGIHSIGACQNTYGIFGLDRPPPTRWGSKPISLVVSEAMRTLSRRGMSRLGMPAAASVLPSTSNNSAAVLVSTVRCPHQPSSASAASIFARIGVGPNCHAIRFASVRCWTASARFFLAL